MKTPGFVMKTLLVGLVLALAPSCAGPCTLIGCNNAVTWKLTTAALQQFGPGEAVTVKACLGSTCSTGTVTRESDGSSTSTDAALMLNASSGTVSFTFAKTVSGAQAVSLELSKASTVFLSDQRNGVTLMERFPNGPACGPACQSATIAL
jgi:hypothetical protein